MNNKEEELIIKYTPLIYKVAKKFYNIEKSDLYQAGCIGLINAYRNYNKEENVNFVNYAYSHIFGKMYELMMSTRDIKVNKLYLKLYKQIKIFEDKFYNENLRKPSIDEISEKLNIDYQMVNEVMITSNKMLSLDEEYNDGEITLKDTIGTDENIDEKILINDSLETLEPLEKDVIKIRYFSDLTQMETAKTLGISQVKVSRIEQKGKQKILEYINS